MPSPRSERLGAERGAGHEVRAVCTELGARASTSGVVDDHDLGLRGAFPRPEAALLRGDDSTLADPFANACTSVVTVHSRVTPFVVPVATFPLETPTAGWLFHVIEPSTQDAETRFATYVLL